METLTEQEIENAIKDYIKAMPSLPTSVTKVMEICNDIHTSPADLNQVISLDPVLVARVIKLINSAYYGLGQHITSLTRAIIMLGINTVKNMALSTAVMGNFSHKDVSIGLDMEGFWRHSLGVGVIAKLLAKKRGIDAKMAEEYFTAGLLHDIGKIPMNSVLSKEYMLAISDADRKRKSLAAMEKNTFGLNHCGAGAMIATAWKLDGAIGDTIIYHHSYMEYSGDYRDVLYSVVAANWFSTCTDVGFSGNRHHSSLNPVLWETLAVDENVFDGFEENVLKEIEKAKIFLKLDKEHT